MRISTLTNNKAFSLLELTVVIIILTILASAAIPVLSRSYIERAANKTALDMGAIQEAARAYYIDQNKWPDSIGTLQAGNYLPSSWNGINPFGINASNPAAYTYNASSTGSIFTVFTSVPAMAEPIIQNLLPTNWTSGNTVYSSVSVPGSSSVMPAGVILPWASANLPAGYLWCNGQTVAIATYPGLYALLGTSYGGDGTTSFALPDLMGRTIVGVDGMGGASVTNRISQWGSKPGTMGGAFGEDAHRQSVQEMAPHNHGETGYAVPGGSIHELRYSDSNQTGDAFSGNYTLSSGGNGDGSGLGAPANVVQPSMALGYIIKY
jgi:prepilin-type N-terminal cleavage/methylation domain-containing protein